MVREAERRKDKYEKKVDGAITGRHIDKLKPSMVEQEATYFAQKVMYEKKIKKLCESQGVATIDLPYYLIFGEQMQSKAKRFSQATLAAEAQNLVNIWSARGLIGSILIKIAKLFGVTPTAPTDLEDKLDDLLSDVAVQDIFTHSRFRVYPQNVADVATLIAAAAINTFGNWAEIIPLNTVLFPFHVVGLVIEQVSAPTTYFIQVGYNTVNADPPANYELGERRLRLVTVPTARATELLEIRGQGIPANSRVMGRLKTASGNADEAEVSVVLTRHLDVSHEKPIWPNFPW